MARRVVVRFAGEPDLFASDTLTIREIKDLIRAQRPALRDKHLRIIHSGRVLEDSSLVPAPEPPPEGQEENVTRLDGNGASSSQASASLAHRTTYLHCAVSDFASEGPSRPTLRPQLGLERLLGVGFSAEEVASIRAQFHALRGTDADDEESARRLEENFLDSATQNSAVADNPFFGNSPGDLLLGLVLGFFLGILSLLLVREPIFNRRVQFGIVVGLLFNVSFGIARLLK
ncbi:DUF2407 C-terminal domain-containing protein [Hyaloraphidium curvatum]|nr:DUF2407 C-terminal domain-containing protein [Hyaloraphidium curvatum]